MNEIANQFVRLFVTDDRSNRNEEGYVVSVCAMPLASLAMTATIGHMLRVIAEMEKRVQPLCRFQIDRPAPPAVSTGRPAAWDELLAAESGDTISTVSAANMYSCPIDEH